MSSRTRTGERLCLAFALTLAFATPACGGKSSRDEVNGQGGNAAQSSSGGAWISTGGTSSTSGGATLVGGGATHAGATSVSGGAANGGATSVSGGVSNGGAALVSGGATNGGATNAGGSASGGVGLACVGLDGSVQLEFRGCLIDSDCETLVVPACCAADRAIGVAKDLMCTVEPRICTEDCIDTPGFTTDDGQRTKDFAEVSVVCQFGEPGAGLCRTTLAGSEDGGALACGNITCDPGELCVHRSARGGPAPRCFPVPADGACPADTEFRADCYDQPGCIELLEAPPPHCGAIPPGCGSPTACACLPAETCGAPQVCSGTMGRHVYCVDQSP